MSAPQHDDPMDRELNEAIATNEQAISDAQKAFQNSRNIMKAFRYLMENPGEIKASKKDLEDFQDQLQQLKREFDSSATPEPRKTKATTQKMARLLMKRTRI